MPKPYKALVNEREFLNLPGFRDGAYVVAYVEDTSAREIGKRDRWGVEFDYYVNPRPRIILELADCSNRINLEFDVHSELHAENSLHKVDTLLAVLARFRAGLAEEAERYRTREREVETLNTRASRKRRSKRRRNR